MGPKTKELLMAGASLLVYASNAVAQQGVNVQQLGGQSINPTTYGTAPSSNSVPTTTFVTNTSSLVSDAAAVATSTDYGTPVVGHNFVYSGNQWVQPHYCGSHAYKQITSSGDTQIIAPSSSIPGAKVYVCDYSISFNGTANAYLETASSGTCGGPTQLDMTWYGVVNAGEKGGKPYYTGMVSGSSGQLCINVSAGTSLSVGVDYDQY